VTFSKEKNPEEKKEKNPSSPKNGKGVILTNNDCVRDLSQKTGQMQSF